MQREHQRGLSLVELLVVLAVIGILATIGIFNYLGALQRSKQKRTMADMRTIASAWEARGSEGRMYNAGGYTFPAAPMSFAQVTALLVPTYSKGLPRVDGWGRPFEFACDQPVGGPPASMYGIRSGGSDAAFEGATYTPGTFSEYDCDIVYSEGTFIRYPADR